MFLYWVVILDQDQLFLFFLVDYIYSMVVYYYFVYKIKNLIYVIIKQVIFLCNMFGMVNNVFEIKLLYSCNLVYLRRILEDLKLV